MNYMLQIEKLDALIESKEAEIIRLREIATGVTQAMKEVNVQSSGSGDKIGTCAVKIADLKNELKEDIERYTKTKREILNNISKLEANEYLVLYKRYFEHKPYELIASEMCYDVRTIFRIHKKALTNLSLNVTQKSDIMLL